MLLASKSFLSKSVLSTEYLSSYTKVDDCRWYSFSESTRIQEIADYGTARQRTLSEDEESGFVWRLFTVARYQQRDGGVYIELEAIVLSRDIPAALQWVVTPIVREVSKSTLLSSLQQTRDAVFSEMAIAGRKPADGRRLAISHPIAMPNTISSFH